MIVKHNGLNKVRMRESLLLPRLVNVSKGLEVNLILSNGTKVTGSLESYGRSLKTLSLNSALSDLRLAGQLLGGLEHLLSLNPDLRHLYGAYRHNGRNQRVISDHKSFILLRDSTVEFNGSTFYFSLLSLPESRILTLSLNSAPRGSKDSKILDSLSSNSKVRDIKRMILTQHRNELKNEAFTVCSRIGNNNVKN